MWFFFRGSFGLGVSVFSVAERLLVFTCDWMNMCMCKCVHVCMQVYAGWPKVGIKHRFTEAGLFTEPGVCLV